MTGLVGAGGGFLIVPTLIVFAGLNMRIAVGTSLLVIALNSLFGFTTSLSKIMGVQWTFYSP
ncbi:MAG: sulfite exporter TauE/SafE family protein [Bdellovibrionales bacterium]|nr:sulfite exporter TauE/SafE family protein [Bdellovibrionales bacterium]